MPRHLPASTLTLAAVLIAVLGLPGVSSGQGVWRVNIADDGSESNGPTHGGGGMNQDGRFVAFASDATNLVPGVRWGPQIYLRDRLRGLTSVMSVDSNGNPGYGARRFFGNSGISRDGRYVVYHTDARGLVPDDTNGIPDVFVHDRQTGITQRVSVDSSGNQGNDWSSRASITEDGRYVLFISSATNLVPNDTNDFHDLFLHDRQTATTTRVNLTHDGRQARRGETKWGGVFLPDLELVVFASEARNLVPGDDNLKADIFVRHLGTGEMTRVSVDSAGGQANDDSYWPCVSADGNLVFFSSSASNLVAGDSNGWTDIFAHDRRTGVTTLVSVDASGTQGNGDSAFVYGPGSCSADGRFVCFGSDADNFPGDSTDEWDIFVKDLATGELRLMTRNANGEQSNGFAWGSGGMSRDGRFVSFPNSGDNLVDGDTNGLGDVFVVGPHLTLEADPEAPAPGDSLSLTTWTGEPGALTLLSIVAVNGVPTFQPLFLSSFDADGVWTIDVSVPGGLSGLTVTLLSYGIAPTGELESTNEELLTF